MNKIKLLYLTLSLLGCSVQAFEFENTTCSITKDKSDSSPIIVNQIKIGYVIKLSSKEANKYGVWSQATNSNEYIEVAVYISDGNVNRSLYRIVDGTLHQSFPSNDGQYTFRRIVPAHSPKIGRYDQVSIKGSSLEYTSLNTIICENNLF